MAQSQFSLSWDAHKKNICSGLSALQQNGEFVDMTLAADGHHVKVHQVIIALASPYIKDLISSAQCQHPVIFLNKISYSTLCAILEYIYTGEVLVSIENLKALVEAGKELHIKGLEDMKLHQALSTRQQTMDYSTKMEEEEVESENVYFEITSAKDSDNCEAYSTNNTILGDITINESAEGSQDENTIIEVNQDDLITDMHIDTHTDTRNKIIRPTYAQSKRITESTRIMVVAFQGSLVRDMVKRYFTPGQLLMLYKAQVRSCMEYCCHLWDGSDASVMQYTVSNQGSLQMILNRFMYYLKHTNRNNTRQWRCVDYLNSTKCPAVVVTRGDVVTQRMSAHTHAFHDKRILKKVQVGAIFTAILEAVAEGENKKMKSAANIEHRQINQSTD